MNSAFRPGNRNRAKPYATSVHDVTVPIIENRAIRIVFNNSRG